MERDGKARKKINRVRRGKSKRYQEKGEEGKWREKGRDCSGPTWSISTANWWTQENIHIIFHSGPLAALCENMKSSIKTEIFLAYTEVPYTNFFSLKHNVETPSNTPHCRQKRTEPHPKVTRTETFTRYGRAVFDICKLTAIDGLWCCINVNTLPPHTYTTWRWPLTSSIQPGHQ